jgi:chemotaxis protein histidine kinase CheA
MECPKCKKQNRPGSKFCRFCGSDLSEQPSHPQTSSGDSHFHIRIPKNIFKFKKISPKIGLVILLIVALTGGTVYAAPKVNDYIKVRAAILDAKEKQNQGEYQAAIDTLNKVEGRWSLQSQKQELTTLKEAQVKFIGYEQIVASSTEKENTGAFKEARDLLQQIGTDYPKYDSSVQPKLAELQGKIEKDLESKATAATAAKVEAERRAQAESAAKAKAQADAQAAAAAKARADADAAAAAQAAQQAEAERQQAAAQRAEEVKRSFRNELTAGYNSYIQGSNYYSSAIQYSNSGNSLLAISQAGSARAVLNSARSTVSDLNYRFTGLPSNYYTAANNMINAIDYLSKALDLLVNTEGTSLDYSSTINSYKNMAISYAGMVKSFLDANSY